MTARANAENDGASHGRICRRAVHVIFFIGFAVLATFGRLASAAAQDCGQVEAVASAPGTWTEQVLYSFANSGSALVNGCGPTAGVIMDSKGNLYGTTTYGGSGRGGVVYKLTP